MRATRIVSFGSSSELDLYEADADLSPDAFRAKHGDAFLLVDIGDNALSASQLEDATEYDPKVVLTAELVEKFLRVKEKTPA